MSVIDELKKRIKKYAQELRNNSNWNNSNHTLTKLEILYEVYEVIEELEALCIAGHSHHFVLYCFKRNCFNIACKHKKYEKCCYCKNKRTVEAREGEG